MILISNDPATTEAVKATGVDPTVYERIGLAAAAGALTDAGMVLLDRAALINAAALGGFDTTAVVMVVLLTEPTIEDWVLTDFADIDRIVVLPTAAAAETRDCPACGAEAGERCRPVCTCPACC